VQAIKYILPAALLFSACASDDRPTSSSPVDTSNILLVKSRTRLEVCIQIDPALNADADALVGKLRADLGAVSAAHPDWRLSGLDRVETRFTIGCPEPLASTRIAAKSDGSMRPAAEPSAFRVHVHILGDVLAATVLGDQASARTAAEVAHVDDHTIVEVSTLLAIRASALGTTALRETALPRAVGLRALDTVVARPEVDL
jgi:xanthine dehydrogenase molybdopterin-binding subunit B